MNKPIFKWAGGKSRLLPQIQAMMPPGKRLVEPFSGGAAVSFNLNYPRYLLADSNKHLIDFYKTLKRDGKEFIEECRQYFSESNNNKERYLTLRTRFNLYQKTACLLYLNRHCFNGLTRYNQSGGYNVPFGDIKKPYFPEQEMWMFMQQSKKMSIKHADFRKIFKGLRAGDVVYCDPPYVPVSKTSSFTAFTAKGFTEKDQQDLAKCAERAAARGIPVLISNSDTPRSREILEGASKIESITARRSISAAGGSRKKVGELLALYE